MAVKKSSAGQNRTGVSKTTSGTSRKTAAGKKKPAPARKTGHKPAARKRPAKKTPAKKAPGKGARPGLAHELKKIALGIAILLAICMTTAMVADILLKSRRTVTGDQARVFAPSESGHRAPKKKIVKNTPSETIDRQEPEPPRLKTRAGGLMEKPDHPGIVYEILDDMDAEHPATRPRLPDLGDKIPKMAIIIDDIGYDKTLAMALFNVEKDITFSVLPFSPFGRSLARRLSAKGAELMLHLPMEPTQYPRVNPGPGALLSAMTPDELLAQLQKDLDDIPGISGVNNHMGSKLTAQSDKMNQVFTVLKKENLFFIDSRTAPDSTGDAAARLFRLRFSHRDIFLDNVQSVDYISGQLNKLVEQARKHGHAIGIGHPYKATLETLKRELPKLEGQVKVVPASHLVAIPG